ncbi:uncharacterized protein LOC118699710 [Molothrus ater]|nr:uncharacterized protein LOC118699710 [Molothrus ater]
MAAAAPGEARAGRSRDRRELGGVSSARRRAPADAASPAGSRRAAPAARPATSSACADQERSGSGSSSAGSASSQQLSKRSLCPRAQAATPNPHARAQTDARHQPRRAPAHGAGGSGTRPADWAKSARRRDASDQRSVIRGNDGRRRLRRFRRCWGGSESVVGGSGYVVSGSSVSRSGAARPHRLAMTRGNQRELARQKNLKKTQEIHKGKRKEDSLSASQRKQRDSEIMQQKQKAANERKSLQAGAK